MSLTISQIIDLLKPLAVAGCASDVLNQDINQIVYHTRELQSGYAFVNFKNEAILNSCSLLLQEEIIAEYQGPQLAFGTQLKERAEQLSLELHRQNWQQVKFLAVTGTNGKSTVVQLCRQMIEAVDPKSCPSSVGTLGIACGSWRKSLNNTTPMPIDLHRAFNELVQRGSKVIVLEASSHGLAQGRLKGLRFEAAAFTSFGQDHLDFHNNMQMYLNAKLKLADLCSGPLVINVDEAAFKTLLNREHAWGYSLEQQKSEAFLEIIKTSIEGFEVQLHFKNKVIKSKVPFWGKHNLQNLCAATGLASALGYPMEALVASWSRLSLPRGRLEKVNTRALGEVLIDYAHTPDALRIVLEAARLHSPKAQLRILFGCGGDRDRGKRPLMGKIAAELADEVILTSDNSRSEDPQSILNQILAGVEQTKKISTEIDRLLAINKALAQQKTGDILLLCGKGHETEQIRGQERIKMDEFEICQNY